MHPSALHAGPERIREEVAIVLASYGKGTGHVCNLGHGIHPDVKPDRAAPLVQAVHELGAIYHQPGNG
jgi:uroporphyrinogen decarboxylase